MKPPEKLSRKAWPRSDLIAVTGVVVTVLTCVGTFLLVPELRRMIGLDFPPSSSTPSGPRQEKADQQSPVRNPEQKPTDVTANGPKKTGKIRGAPSLRPAHSEAQTLTGSDAYPTFTASGLSAQGMYDRGTTYYLEKNYQQARYWYRGAAEGRNADAMYSLGRMYEQGEGVKPSPLEALEWYLKAADAGSKDAFYGVGHMYDNGEGVKQDHEKARQWFEKAADRGCVPAMTALGLLYENALVGKSEDYAQARKWYERAAQAGDARAKERLLQLSQR